MATHEINSTTKIVLIAEFVLLAYMLYVLSTSLYKSYQVDNFIQTAENENTRLQQENMFLSEDFDYYSSQSYKEKIAKQNFGLVRPGEEVIVVIPHDLTPRVSNEDRAQILTQKYYSSLSNPQKWYLFLFERDRFSIGY